MDRKSLVRLPAVFVAGFVAVLAPACGGGFGPGVAGGDGVGADPGAGGAAGASGGATRGSPGGALPGADPGTPAPTGGMGDLPRTTPTGGSAVAVTRDDAFAVAANRTAGRVSIFKLAFGTKDPAVKAWDLDVGRGSEPWSVVIGNDDDTAYVILRRDQKVLRIRHLRGTPAIDPVTCPTGAEPTGLAISPRGATLFVANWAEGSVSVIDAASMTARATVDLNGALAASGLLGSYVKPRPALAHPRALVVTNDGDGADDDETVFVTEFFSQARTDGLPADDSQFDVARQGVVYAVDTATLKPEVPITLAPIADTGFPDSKGAATGCFPNQLYATALNGGRLYVTSVCESPRGPVGPDPAAADPTANFKTQVHAAIFVVDVASRRELPGQALLLTRAFDRAYADRKKPDDESRRMPLIPTDIMFAAGSTIGYVTGYGSDAVFRIAYKADGSVERVGADSQMFIDLKPGGNVADGVLPVGIASANGGFTTVPFAVTINENSRNLSVLGFGTQNTVAAVPATDPPAPGLEQSINRGQKFLATGLGRWSSKGQAWLSCAACHPDGLTDDVTWFFGRGPRQTIALDSTYDPKDPTRRRILNWTAFRDELHDFEANTRDNSGGAGAVVFRAGPPIGEGDRIVFDGKAPSGEQQATPTPQGDLSGSLVSLMPRSNGSPKSVLPDWDDIEEATRAIRTPRAPTTLVADDVKEGRKLFEANGCAGCHGGSQWTISNVFYTPGEENNGAGGLLRTTAYTRPALFTPALNPPSAETGSAPLRLAGAAAGADQINCVLRDVATFPATGLAGVAPAGVVVKEVRQDMSTPAQGATGFNPPSLLGMATGAPYFHAGAARTLEESLGEAFDRHRRAFAENFRPDENQVRQLTAFLLSIDEAAAPPAVPMLGFPFDLCAQIPAGVIR